MHTIRTRGLVIRFALSSLVPFVALGLVASSVVTGVARQRAEDAAREHARFVVAAILRNELTAAQVATPITPDTPRYGELLRLVRTSILRVGFPVVRLKIWRADGTVIFSDEPRLIGRRFPVEDDLHEAFAGTTVSGISDLSASENVFERGLAPQLLETYVPMRLAGDPGHIPGVAELYTDIGALRAQTAHSFRLLWIGLLAGLAGLYLLQLPLARRLARTMTAQNRRLGVLLEREQRTVAELQDLGQQKSQFIAMASHELRTPLTSILGYAKTLRRPEFSADDVARDEFLAAIERQGDRLSRVVENLLTSSELESGSLEPIVEPVDFSDVAGLVIAAFGPGAARFRMEIPAALPLVPTDRRLLMVVLANLADNALKFSSDACELGAAASGRVFTFWVRDRGTYIPPDRRAEIFDRFRQADSSSTRAYGGLGLGLSLAREVVQRLGGRIQVESEPEVGNTFTVVLPLRQPVRSPVEALRA